MVNVSEQVQRASSADWFGRRGKHTARHCTRHCTYHPEQKIRQDEANKVLLHSSDEHGNRTNACFIPTAISRHLSVGHCNVFGEKIEVVRLLVVSPPAPAMNTFEDVPFDETDLALWGIGKLIKLWRLFQVHPSSQSFFFSSFPFIFLTSPYA